MSDKNILQKEMDQWDAAAIIVWLDNFTLITQKEKDILNDDEVDGPTMTEFDEEMLIALGFD